MNRIAVLGDIMLDMLYKGNCCRMLPESTTPVILKDIEMETLGGAANVYNNIVALGKNVDLFSVIGNDFAGNKILCMISDKKQYENIVVVDGLKSTVKCRVLSNDNHTLFRIDDENIELMQKLNLEKTYEKILNKIKSYSIVVISDYCKGFLSETFIQRVIAICIKNDIKILVDTKRKNIGCFANCHTIKITKKELFNIYNLSCGSVTEYAQRLLKELKCQNVIITDEGNSVKHIYNGGEKYYHPPVTRVIDSTGAGDVFMSVIASCLSEGETIENSIELAIDKCSIAISKLGTSIVDGYVNEQESIIKKLLAKKNSGNKVVFVNGCFDVIHIGHIKLLSTAKKSGDILVVAINSDDSIRRLKGKCRPVNSQEERKSVLESIKYVDYVIIFDEDTPCELISKLQPSIIYKGSEYSNKKIPELETIKNLDCEIRYISQVKQKSSSAIIERMYENIND